MSFLSVGLALAVIGGLSAQQPPSEAEYYPIEAIPIPEGIVMEVGSIEVLPGQRLAVATRRGEIYTVSGAYGEDLSQVRYALFAEGLHEVLGLTYHEGALYVTQRPELTRLIDEDDDGRADLFETLSDAWGICGDYHEYAFGSRHDKDGNLWVVLCLTGSGGTWADFRGWAVRVTPDGEMLPTASGIRSPAGIGTDHLGEMFFTDAQGPWNGSSSLKHLRVGSFQGNPTGNVHYQLTRAIGPRPADPRSGSRIVEEVARIPEFVPPACILPHGDLGNNPSGIACDKTEGAFGPFEHQLFLGEQSGSQVQRVALEKVNGVYQGACFPFLSGFGSGNVAIRFGEDGTLFNGGTNRGWGSRGPKSFAFERVRWTGKVPFEMHRIEAKPDGFVIHFTRPAAAGTLENADSFGVKAFTYIHQSSYGSPKVDSVDPGHRGGGTVWGWTVRPSADRSPHQGARP